MLQEITESNKEFYQRQTCFQTLTVLHSAHTYYYWFFSYEWVICILCTQGKGYVIKQWSQFLSVWLGMAQCNKHADTE